MPFSPASQLKEAVDYTMLAHVILMYFFRMKEGPAPPHVPMYSAASKNPILRI